MGETWKPLDLRRRATLGPKDGELILLQLVYKMGPNLFGRDYRVVRLRTVQGVTMAEGGYYGRVSKLNEGYWSVSWIRLPEDDKEDNKKE